MPQTVTALTGSCVQIPCTFNISNFEDIRKKAKSIYGIWLKNISQYKNKDSFIVFNSSENIIRGFSDIQMTGDLNKRNCTTVFYNIMKNHSDRYYFRLEMEPDVFRATFPKSTDSSETVKITIRGKCHLHCLYNMLFIRFSLKGIVHPKMYLLLIYSPSGHPDVGDFFFLQ